MAFKRMAWSWNRQGCCVLFSFDVTLLSISFLWSKIETIPISHRNNIFSYCLKLLNIPWKVFVIVVNCLSHDLVTWMWIIMFRLLHWITVEKRRVQFSLFEWMNRTGANPFEWMPQFSKRTLLVGRRMENRSDGYWNRSNGCRNTSNGC